MKRRILTIMVVIVFFLLAKSGKTLITTFSHPPVLLTGGLFEPLEIDPNGSLIFEFDQMMNRASVEKSFIFNDLPYTLAWKNFKTLLFKPRLPLEESKLYVITIKNTAQNIFRKRLQKSQSREFRLGEEPRILKIIPEEKLLKNDEKIVIFFSSDMEEKNDIALSPLVPGHWQWINAKTLVFTPKNRYPSSTQFTLRNTIPLETKQGTLLKKQISKVYETERLQVQKYETTPLLTVFEPFTLRFNGRVDSALLKFLVMITDHLGKAVSEFQVTELSSGVYTLKPEQGSWMYNETYTITVSDRLKAKEGNLSLGKEEQISFQTESLLIPEEKTLFEQGKWPVSNGIIRLLFKEDVSPDQLKKVLKFVPEQTFEFVQEDQLIKIMLKNQNITGVKMYLLSDIKKENRFLISSPLNFSLEEVNPLNITLQDQTFSVCLKSNHPLNREKSSVFLLANNTSEKLIASDDEECKKQGIFAYQFSKTSWYQEKERNVQISLEDIYEQKREETFEVPMVPLQSVSMLERTSPSFYQQMKSSDEVKFSYRFKNVPEVNIELCKLSYENVLTIETRFEKRWNDFSLSQDICLALRTLSKKLNSPWNQVTEDTIPLKSIFKDLDPGMYFVRVFAPQIKEEDGNFLETSGVLQYSNLDILSKRGDSALIWVLKDGQPLKDVSLRFYASDGSLLKTGKTKKDGVYFLERNKMKYEHVLAEKKEDKIFLSLFDQRDIKPEIFSIPFNADESAFRYQFYIEEPSDERQEVSGVFMVKEKKEGKLFKPDISIATLFIMNQFEEVLLKEKKSFDAFGTFFFTLPLRSLERNDPLRISVCLGLFDGICQGTNLWADLIVDQDRGQHFDDQEKNKNLLSGRDLKLSFPPLNSSKPVLVTIERDTVLFQKVFLEEEWKEELIIPIRPEMVPEVFVSFTQFTDDGISYKLQAFDIPRSLKQLQISLNNQNLEVKNADGISVPTFSSFIFELNEGFDFLSKDSLLRTFYPRLGTSMITTASKRPLQNNNPETGMTMREDTLISEIIKIPGRLLKTSEVKEGTLVLVHDQEGNFGQATMPSKAPLMLTAEIPEFVRLFDRIVLPITIENNSPDQKNVTLKAEGESIQFVNGPTLFLGLAPKLEKQVAVEIFINDYPEGNNAPLSFQIEQNGILEASFRSSFKILPESSFMKQISLITGESSRIRLVMAEDLTGFYDRQITIAPSPISFVLPALEDFLKKPSRDILDDAYKSVLSVLFSKLTKKESPLIIQTLFLNHLQREQATDGGFGSLLKTAKLARALSFLEQAGEKISPLVKKKMMQFLKKTLEKKSLEKERNVLEEIWVLNAISSHEASGTFIAREWLAKKETLPSEVLILLLLTFEDYRDAGVKQTEFAIEELIELLKTRQKTDDQSIWLEPEDENTFTSFELSSFYLEALVRQKSARKEVPKLITWLSNHQTKYAFQSSDDQVAYLQSMGEYLKIYRETISANEVTIKNTGKPDFHFSLEPAKTFQSFFFQDLFAIETEKDNKKEILLELNQRQPLFTQIILQKTGDQQVPKDSSGLSVHLEFPSSNNSFQRGEEGAGNIHIFSADDLSDLVLIQPLMTGAELKVSPLPGTRTVMTVDQELWTFFDTISAGETIVPFQLVFKTAGVLHMPALFIFRLDQPEIRANSENMMIPISL